jgi:hypothetical protein
MSRSRWTVFKRSAAILFLCASLARANAQSNPPEHHGEQTSFSVEFDFEHPVPVNQAAKEALAASPRIVHELKQKHVQPKDLPDEWFTASRVHLGADGESGLVVMGVDGLLGANITSFWVLRRTANGYDLVLDTIAAGLEFSAEKTNGLRNIETFIPGGAAYVGSDEFQFDGRRYQATRRTSQRTGTKVPTDLKGYETHASFVQQTASDTLTLADARTWIWQHWKARKPFYVTVVEQDDDGSQTTYGLYTSDDSDNPGLVLEIHKSHWQQDSQSGLRRKVMDDDRWVASDVERVYPAVDKDHDPQIIGDESGVAASVYRLGFRDGIFWLATL